MPERPEFQHSASEVGQREEGRVHRHPGQYGVSDDRRAELSRMEREAGGEHEGPDQTVTQRPETDSARGARDASDRTLERPGDRH